VPLRTIGFMAAAILLLYLMFTVGFPFLLALIVAILLEPFVGWLQRGLKLNRVMSALTVCSLFLIGALALVIFIGLTIFNEFVEYMGKVPAIISEADRFVREAVVGEGILYRSFPEDWAGYIQSGVEMGLEYITQGINFLVTSLSGMMLGIAKTVPNLLIFLIVFVIALYLISFGLPNIRQAFLSIFAENTRHKMEAVLEHLRVAVVGFLKAQILLSFLTYIVSLVGLLFLGVSYPLAIALLIIIVDLLPILGTGSVLVPWAIYSFVAGDQRLGIGLIILFVVITIFRRIAEPKIVADAVGISALAALVSLYIGLQLAGLAGLFLGPLVVIFYQAVKKAGLLKLRIEL
jgi:sporulation integral membrane protein YtvI